MTRNGETLATAASATAVTASGMLVLLAYEFGPRSVHMALHIAAMSVLAPITALIFASQLPRWTAHPPILWVSAATQLMLLWGWHVPAVEQCASASHLLHAGALLSLFVVSFAFWSGVIRVSGQGRWHTIAALLLTGKLTCLLSALLVFAPRALYGSDASIAPLADQQLAGLLMITACPLSYLVAAVVIASRLIGQASAVVRSGSSPVG